MRADAQRNRDRLVAEARTAFLAAGTTASLEEIARRAGVGIGTLYRHFPARGDLVDAVFHGEAQALLTLAADLRTADPFADLAAWLRAVLTRHRACLAIAQATGESQASLADLRQPVEQAGADLLARAQQAGSARPDAQVRDLMRLATAIGLVADEHPAEPGLADRLLSLAVDGLRAR
ncbi:TetR/AcrR family transcriptional regulator [Crossiella sp. CA198]|uniref:TetR/AcrR family transcriptional regulator n=1 Tax=Crossiella sp. CA198 TaxID=3455607 RepID=UPI003F8D2AFE